MDRKVVRADALLLLTAAVWGFAFVAQRIGMESIGPFAFNGIRFVLGSLSLLPLIRLRAGRDSGAADTTQPAPPANSLWRGALLAGVVLFIAASLQQIGIQYTTAGKAGFLTGLYVVLVPIAGIALGHRTGLATWVAAILAAAGMYVLSAPDQLGRVNPGDLLVIASAVFWTVHVLIIDRLSRSLDPIRLASAQFAWCGLLSLATSAVIEPWSLASVLAAAWPILYGGLASVGIGYTLQVVAQRDAPPAHSAILLSLEGLFATIGGIIILREPMALRNIMGSALMLAGMLATQWDVVVRSTRRAARSAK